jgi:uncharacterized membrane protein
MPGSYWQKNVFCSIFIHCYVVYFILISLGRIEQQNMLMYSTPYFSALCCISCTILPRDTKRNSALILSVLWPCRLRNQLIKVLVVTIAAFHLWTILNLVGDVY